MNIDIKDEIEIRTSRSGGKGGQNVNKVETRVEARWHVNESTLFTEEQKALLKERLSNRISKENILIVQCNEDRTQLSNKEKAIRKMNAMIERALQQQAIRKATKIPRAVKERRLEGKKKKGELKNLRKKIAY